MPQTQDGSPVTQQNWDRLCHEAAADNEVNGLVLTGGRGKGVATESSDWDAVLVATDTSVHRWSSRDFGGLDVSVISATGFVGYAEPGDEFSWRGYDFAHLHPVVDRNGFGALLERKAGLSAGRAREVAEESVGAALNYLYRATKNDRDGNRSATELDLAEMAAPFLTALFALDGRLRPYNKLLGWELERMPLRQVTIEAKRLVEMLTQTVRAADLPAAWTLAEHLAHGCRTVGVTGVLDSWEDHLVEVRPTWVRR